MGQEGEVSARGTRLRLFLFEVGTIRWFVWDLTDIKHLPRKL